MVGENERPVYVKEGERERERRGGGGGVHV